MVRESPIVNIQSTIVNRGEPSGTRLFGPQGRKKTPNSSEKTTESGKFGRIIDINYAKQSRKVDEWMGSVFSID